MFPSRISPGKDKLKLKVKNESGKLRLHFDDLFEPNITWWDEYDNVIKGWSWYNSNDDAKIMNIGDDDSDRDDKAEAHNGEEDDEDGDDDERDDEEDDNDEEDDDAHNGEEDDEDGDDCDDARMLAGLGILKQEPDAPDKSKFPNHLQLQMNQ